MKVFTLGWLAEKIGGKLVPYEASDVYAYGVSIDSRTIRPGEVFFALKGERFDGHSFVKEAVNSGGVCVVVSEKPENGYPYIMVNDTLFALGELAKHIRAGFSFPVIGITGSVGKTTTKEVVARLLSVKGEVVSSPKSFNNFIGLPLTIIGAGDDARFGVFELGVNRAGEMDRLIDIAKPEVGIITAVAAAHTEGLRSVDGVLDEKIKLLERIPESGIAFVNGDFEMLKIKAKLMPKRVIFYGTKRGVDIRAERVNWGRDGLRFEIDKNEFFSPILGRFWVYSFLAAYCVGREFGIGVDEMKDVFSSFAGLDGRMKPVEKSGVLVIDDSYNANPLAVKESLQTIYGLKAKRRLVFLGDMLELGDLEEIAHREVGRLVVDFGFDYVVFVGSLMRFAFEVAIASGGNNVKWFENLEDVYKYVEGLKFCDGDIILVKGSRRMNMDKLVQFLLEVI